MCVSVSEYYNETIYDSIEKHAQVSRRRDLGLVKKCWECCDLRNLNEITTPCSFFVRIYYNMSHSII